ncbi:MAG: chaperone protein DnaK-like protein [Actinomycetospora sp.]|nr:chaperone protein DnaK-like protein [Actinomycetospora sp.]
MSYHLGIDLGTTITTAAVHRDGRVDVASLGEHTAAMPSVVLWSAEGPPLVGDAAERGAVAHPGRVARAIRPRLADPAPFLLDGAPFAAGALLGVLLRRVVDVVAAQEGGAPAATVLTHPASWNAADRDAFAGVAGTLGLGEVSLVSEPEAAARQHAADNGLREDAIVAVVDLGGGSVDATVLRHRSGVFTVLGRPEGLAYPVGAQPADEDVVAGLYRTLASAQVVAADLDAVVLAGWSPRIGSVAASIADALGRPVAVDPEPEHAVARGAARLAARSAEDGATRAVGLARTRPVTGAPLRAAEPVTGPSTGPSVPATGPAAAVGAAPVAPVRPVRPARPKRRGVAVALAAAAVAVGVLGGGAIALAGAASPAAAAAAAPVAEVSEVSEEPAPEVPVEVPAEAAAEPVVAPSSSSAPPAVAPAAASSSSSTPAPRSAGSTSGGSTWRPPTDTDHREPTDPGHHDTTDDRPDTGDGTDHAGGDGTGGGGSGGSGGGDGGHGGDGGGSSASSGGSGQGAGSQAG